MPFISDIVGRREFDHGIYSYGPYINMADIISQSLMSGKKDLEGSGLYFSYEVRTLVFW
ncbi:hypothetical protein GCM10010965_32550 [Caldalkalibacillus thermarum]|nr:hypothetical protein GCM10010965_32550 [Caldalkalibacillus thermarum]